jgi:hypothetical protein
MKTKPHDPPLGVDAMHAEGPERKRFGYIEESGLFYRCHDFRLEQQAVRGAFQWKEVSLITESPGHTHWIHSHWQGMLLDSLSAMIGVPPGHTSGQPYNIRWRCSFWSNQIAVLTKFIDDSFAAFRHRHTDHLQASAISCWSSPLYVLKPSTRV